MDASAGRPYGIRHSSNSSSSAVDLSGTGTGLGVQAPSSALRPSDADGRGHTRRRLSWSNAEGRPGSRPNVPVAGPSNLAVSEEDSFFFTADGRLRKDESSLFPTPHPDASSTSLLSTYGDVDLADDETRLTGEVQPQVDGHWSGNLLVDSERSAGFSSRPRRQHTAPSPLRRTITNAFRRASMRVANVRGHGPYARFQEDSEGSDSGSTLDGAEQLDSGERVAYRTLPSILLRGRALGILGPTNPLRIRLYKLLIHPYVCFRPSLHLLRL